MGKVPYAITGVVAITTSLQSPEPTIRLPSVDASNSVHIGTIAGVAGCVAVIAILVVLVLLVVLILWKRKKDKELTTYVMSTIIACSYIYADTTKLPLYPSLSM